MRTVSIIGVGRVGGAFALALTKAGYKVKLLVSNNPESTKEFAATFDNSVEVLRIDDVSEIETDLLLITTRDREIREAADRIAKLEFDARGLFAFHASGVLSSSELSSLQKKGAETGSIHPLISITDPFVGSEGFRDAFFCIEGSANALNEAAGLVSAVGGSHFQVEKEFKALYHAAAVLACGHLTALLDTSVRTLEKCGLEKSRAFEVLLPLIKSTIDNIAESGTNAALTGPFARADTETIEKHIAEIKKTGDAGIECAYKALGEISLEIAIENGLARDSADRIRNSILLDKSGAE